MMVGHLTWLWLTRRRGPHGFEMYPLRICCGSLTGPVEHLLDHRGCWVAARCLKLVLQWNLFLKISESILKIDSSGVEHWYGKKDITSRGYVRVETSKSNILTQTLRLSRCIISSNQSQTLLSAVPVSGVPIRWLILWIAPFYEYV
jgi:hypothetical protein